MKINGKPDGGGGGAAVWGGITGNINSQTDLNQKFVKKTGLKTVNEQSLVGSGDIEVGTLNPEDLKTINSTSLVGEGDIVTGTLNPEDLKTINSQSIVGTGDIEIGGLTPEQEAAIEPLEEPSEGILYTTVMNHYTNIFNNCSAPEISSNLQKVYDVGNGEIYYTYQNQLWKYNPVLMDFEKVAEFNIDITSYAIWKDNSGRLHYSKNYELDIENQEAIYHEASTGYDIRRADSYNRPTLFKGDKGIYSLNPNSWGSSLKTYKFDEETQTFNTGQKPTGDITTPLYFAPYFKFKGHYLFTRSGQTYEITEGDDEVLTATNVTGTYFEMPNFDSINNYKFFVKNGVLWYIHNDIVAYWDEEGSENEWVEISTPEIGFDTYYVVSGDFVIGGYNTNNTTLMFYNLGDDYRSTSWIPVNTKAVDLSSDQTINGNKTFNNNITVNGTHYVEGDMIFNNGGVTINGDFGVISNSHNINIFANEVRLNHQLVATLDKCIYNTTENSPGQNFSPYPTYIGGSQIDENWKMWYVTPSNRVIYVNDYRNNVLEYDPINNQFTQISMNNKIVSSHRAVLNNNSELWVAKNGGVYRWNDTTSDFDFITSTPDGGDWIWQGDDTTLRYKSLYVLVYDSGTDTYSWDNATYSGPYDEVYSYYVNGDIYLYSTNNGCLYSWDETTGNSNVCGYLAEVPKDEYYIARVGTSLYYYGDFGVRKICPWCSDPDFDIQTNIPVSRNSSSQQYPPILDYNGKYYTTERIESAEYFNYTYEYYYWTPQPDTSTDGTYTLKATVLNGQVTYSWVADV